jgi:putative spermidine/putrescine transport system substrate-binding protein
VQKFRQGLKQSLELNLTPEPQLAGLFEQLQTWKVQSATSSQPTVPSLVTLGDYWLGEAIQQRLIQPLNPLQLPHWNQLPSQWKTLVTRDRQGNLAAQGQVWGAPYRWGTTLIAYRKDKFKRLGWIPSDWGDLWRSQLRRRISLLNQPREVIGLTLKKMGHSYNSQNIRQIPGLEAELRALHQQVKLYSSDAYLQPLALGDTWVAVGWSTDVLPIVRQNRLIGAIVPQSGTALWSDIWVQPASALKDVPQALINQWIDFWWLPEIASQLSRLSDATSPILSNLNSNKLPSLLDQQQFSRSEMLKPLPTTTVDQYRDLWPKIRGFG